MASIAKQADGTWRARYRCAQPCTDREGRKRPPGHEHARPFKLRQKAQVWLDQKTADVVTGHHVDPQASRVLFATVAATWATNPTWSASTRARAVGILRHHVLPRWGDVQLNAITHEDAQAWVNALSATGLAGGTVRKVAGVLSGVLSKAVKARRLRVNPADGLDLPRQRLAKRKYLTAGQVEAFRDAAGDWGDLVGLLAYTGLRIGEAAALRVRSVDMLRRRLTIDESVTEVDGKLVWSSPKDHQRRSVPFPAFLAAGLDARMAGKGSDDLLFTTASAATVRVRNMRRDWFDRATQAVGLDGLTPHELRHTAASLAVGAGANVLAVQRMLGHEKPSTTLDVYSDLFDGDLDAVADALDGARAVALADQMRTKPPISIASNGAAT